MFCTPKIVWLGLAANTHHAPIVWFQREAEDRAEVDFMCKKQTRTKL